jgi:ribonuclease PH
VTQGRDSLAWLQAREVQEALSAVLLLDRYPNSAIDVRCMVLEQGGAEVSALVMAAALAACDADLHLRCVLTAASLVRSSFFTAVLVSLPIVE